MPEITNKYNNKIHSSIQMTPVEASNNPEKLSFINTENNYYNENHLKRKPNKFNVGDRIRIFKWKNKFEKGFRGYWTNEIFKISEVIKTVPFTYRIKDLNNEEIEGTFYPNEISKTAF